MQSQAATACAGLGFWLVLADCSGEEAQAICLKPASSTGWLCSTLAQQLYSVHYSLLPFPKCIEFAWPGFWQQGCNGGGFCEKLQKLSQHLAES